MSFRDHAYHLDEYQVEAVQYAMYQHWSYPLLGLVAEHYEYLVACDQRKPVYVTTSEIGDMFWMLAAYAQERGWHLGDCLLAYVAAGNKAPMTNVCWMKLLGAEAKRLRGDMHPPVVEKIWLGGMTMQCIGYGVRHKAALKDVLASNLAKLSDRQARGTIQGQGDDR